MTRPNIANLLGPITDARTGLPPRRSTLGAMNNLSDALESRKKLQTLDFRFTSLVWPLDLCFLALYQRYAYPSFKGPCFATLHLLTCKLVLWTEANIHNLHHIFFDMVDPMRRRAKYADALGRKISQWPIRKCIPRGRWWNYSGLVRPSAAVDSDDHLRWFCLYRTSRRTPRRRLHQLLCKLVNPPTTIFDATLLFTSANSMD
jgi:hypothetical protein